MAIGDSPNTYANAGKSSKGGGRKSGIRPGFAAHQASYTSNDKPQNA
jgi:hypothetical protein